MRKIIIFYALFIFLCSGQVMAQSSSSSSSLPSGGNLFNLRVTVDNDGMAMQDMFTRSFGFDDATEALELFEGESLESLFRSEGSFTGYMDDSTVSASVNYQGVLVRIAYPDSSSLLTFEVPDLNTTAYCFVAADAINASCTTESGELPDLHSILDGNKNRDSSQEALEDFLIDSGLANRLWKLLAASSPTSPLAGNPSSMQSAQVSSTFSNTTGTGGSNQTQSVQATPIRLAQADGQLPSLEQNVSSHKLPVGAQFGRYSQGGKDVNNYSLPIRYAYEWPDGREFSVSLPLGYTTIENAKVYSASLAVSYKFPVNDRWALTPGIIWGVTGSKDLLTGVQIGSLSLTSLYELDKSVVGGDDWSLSIANMVTYSQSFPIEISDIKIDPDLTNQIIKNGLILDTKEKLGIPMNIKAYITDTRFFGDALYSERYNEIGLFMSPAKKSFLGENQGLNFYYLFAERGINGFNLSYSYNF